MLRSVEIILINNLRVLAVLAHPVKVSSFELTQQGEDERKNTRGCDDRKKENFFAIHFTNLRSLPARTSAPSQPSRSQKKASAQNINCCVPAVIALLDSLFWFGAASDCERRRLQPPVIVSSRMGVKRVQRAEQSSSLRSRR